VNWDRKRRMHSETDCNGAEVTMPQLGARKIHFKEKIHRIWIFWERSTPTVTIIGKV
jgi:hypothetical protein